MSKARSQRNGASRYVDITQLQAHTNTGRSTAMKLGKESGALIKIGKRSIYDLDVIDRYLESIRLKNAPSNVSDVIAETKKARASYNEQRSRGEGCEN